MSELSSSCSLSRADKSAAQDRAADDQRKRHGLGQDLDRAEIRLLHDLHGEQEHEGRRRPREQRRAPVAAETRVIVISNTSGYPPHSEPAADGGQSAAGFSSAEESEGPVQLVREHLASGRLVELVAGATLDRPLSWQVNRLAADHLSDLTRHVMVTARSELT